MNYSEIKCDHLGTDGYWYVDAWRSDNPNEEGRVVAAINDKTGDVFYTEPEAIFSIPVQEVVKAKIAEIKARHPDLPAGTVTSLVDEMRKRHRDEVGALLHLLAASFPTPLKKCSLPCMLITPTTSNKSLPTLCHITSVLPRTLGGHSTLIVIQPSDSKAPVFRQPGDFLYAENLDACVDAIAAYVDPAELDVPADNHIDLDVRIPDTDITFSLTGLPFSETEFLFKNIPAGAHVLSIRAADDDDARPATLERHVAVNHFGDVLVTGPVGALLYRWLDTAKNYVHITEWNFQ